MADSALLDQRHRELDRKLVETVRKIRLLAHLSWPASEQQRFLSAYDRGQPYLPQIEYPAVDLADEERELAGLVDALGEDSDPINAFLRAQAESYLRAALLLDARGTMAFTEHSAKLYGRPGDAIADGRVSNLDAALHFLDIADQYRDEFAADLHATTPLSAADLKAQIEPELTRVFGAQAPRVELDPDLVSKAAAGTERIRLRDSATFSPYDVEQLLEHEAFIHSLTRLNGLAQPQLTSLSLAAPRTTGIQEGLAVFAELITGAIDLKRLKRISLRIAAIDRALAGADFVEVYRYLLDFDQDPNEAFLSAMRVFRGVPTSGGAAFTKDVVYVHGLLSVHTFFRWALKEGRLSLVRLLFAGRMTLQDLLALEPLFDSGILVPPRFLPPWLSRFRGLAGYLSFAVFANRIRLDRVAPESLRGPH